jgi:hypothetical protein
MAQAQNKNKKNPTHEKPVPATVLPNNLDTETKTSNCTPKEIYVEILPEFGAFTLFCGGLNCS